LLASTAGLAARAIISPLTNLTVNWAWLDDTVPSLTGVAICRLTTVLFLDLDATDAFLHTIAASLRAISPSLPLIPFSMNWAMGKEACLGLFVCTSSSRAFYTTMFCLDTDLTIAYLFTIPTGGGTVAPRCPLREHTVNRAFLVVAVAFMFQLLIHDAFLTWKWLVEVALRATMLWRHRERTRGGDCASTACHTAFTLCPIIGLTINWAREGITVSPAIQLIGARVTAEFGLNLDVSLLLLGTSTT
jgi:hypothetical protein